MHAGSHAEWEDYQSSWESRFPSDYIAFVRAYGAGSFFEELQISTPFENPDILKRQSLIEPTYASLRQLSAKDRPHDFFPVLPGLIYLGGTSSGDEIFWLAQGNPDTWGVVVYDRNYLDYERFDFGIVEFLARWLDGSLKSENMWPAAELRDLREPPIFRSVLG